MVETVGVARERLVEQGSTGGRNQAQKGPSGLVSGHKTAAVLSTSKKSCQNDGAQRPATASHTPQAQPNRRSSVSFAQPRHQAAEDSVPAETLQQADKESSLPATQPTQQAGSPCVVVEAMSDSDTDTSDEPERNGKAEDPDVQSFRNYKGVSRQGIRLAFLEEGGYFDLPIKEAAARLGLGITTLKRACRVNGMMRWPYRKRNSLGRLIDRTQQVLDDGTGQDNMQKLAALQVLEKQRQILRNRQSEVDAKTKSFRRAVLDRATHTLEEAPVSEHQHDLY